MNERDTLERELRAALHGLADDHVPPPLPRDLWQRGRTPARRNWDALTVAAAVVLVVLLASALLLQRPDQLLQPAEAPGEGALPTDVWLPGELDPDEAGVVDLDAVGRASFAGLLTDGTALLVDAKDGEHQLRTLPGLSPLSASDPVALSPDGTRLAWAYLDDDRGRAATLAGVGVADLVDGSWVPVPLRSDSGRPVRVDALQWSYDGSRLAWSGAEFEPDEGDTDRDPLVGVVSADGEAGRTWQLPVRWPATVLAPTDEGGLVVSDQTTLWRLSADEPPGLLDPADGVPLPGIVDGAEQVVTPLSPDGSRFVTASSDDDAGRGRTVEVLVDDPAVTPEARLWPTEELARVTALGWTADGAVLALTADNEPRVLRAGPGADDAPVALTWLHLDDGSLTDHSVATGLGDADPVAFAPPPWVPTRSPWWTVGLLSGAVLVAAWLARRRLRRVRPDRAELARWAVAVGIVVLGLAGLLTDLLPVAWIVGAAVVVGLASTLREGVRPVRGGLVRLVVLSAVVAAASAPWWPRAAPTSDEPVLPRVAHPPASLHEEHEEAEEGWPRTVADPPGAASVTLLSDWGDTVALVDPHDGTHRQRALPGLERDAYGTESTPVLDPSGTRLAWPGTGDPVDRSGGFDEDAWSGVGILDLTTGELTQVPLAGRHGKPVQVLRLSWSADGSHLAWYGDEAARWNENGASWAGRARTAGVTRVADLTSASWHFADLPSPWSTAVAVDGEGVARLLSGRRMWTYALGQPDREPEVRRVSRSARRWSSAVVSPDGGLLYAGVNGGQEVQGDVTGLRSLDLTAPDSGFALHPWRGAEPGARVDVLGLDPGGLPVVLHTPAFTGSDQEVESTVRVLGGREDRLLTRVRHDPFDSPRMSVATDLTDRESVGFAKPRPPMGDGHVLLLAVTGAALVAQLVQLARLGWRRRSSRRG